MSDSAGRTLSPSPQSDPTLITDMLAALCDLRRFISPAAAPQQEGDPERRLALETVDGLILRAASAIDTVAPVLTELQDWRIAHGDDCDEQLDREALKAPWKASITDGDGGLQIRFEAPDGTNRELKIEIDRGNVAVFPYPDEAMHEEPYLKLSVGDDQAHVEQLRGFGHRRIVFEGEQTEESTGPAPTARLEGIADPD